MWSYLTRSFINPLLGYVEIKLATPKTVYARRNDLSARAFNHIAGFVSVEICVRA